MAFVKAAEVPSTWQRQGRGCQLALVGWLRLGHPYLRLRTLNMVGPNTNMPARCCPYIYMSLGPGWPPPCPKPGHLTPIYILCIGLFRHCFMLISFIITSKALLICFPISLFQLEEQCKARITCL
ncbi:hypothetical protein Pfo_016335, partial [Paulownia fortunei]